MPTFEVWMRRVTCHPLLCACGLFDSPPRSRFSHVVAGTCSRLLRTVFHYLPHTFDGHDSPARYAGWGPFLPPDGEGSPESGRGSGLRGHIGRQRWAGGPPRALPWIPTPQTPQHCTEPRLPVSVTCSGTFPSSFTSILCAATEVPSHIFFCSVEMDTHSLLCSSGK